jgi:hypothetical protein
MARIKVNTGVAGNVSGEVPEMPDGDYEVTVKTIEEREGSKAPYLAVDMVVEDGPFKRYHVFDNLSTSEKAAWKLGAFFKALGVPDLSDDQEVETDDFIGRPIIVTVEAEEYEGKRRPRVKKYRMHPAVKEWTADEVLGTEATGTTTEETTSETTSASPAGTKQFSL